MFYMYCITLQEGIEDRRSIVPNICVAVDPDLNFVFKLSVVAQNWILEPVLGASFALASHEVLYSHKISTLPMQDHMHVLAFVTHRDICSMCPKLRQTSWSGKHFSLLSWRLEHGFGTNLVDPASSHMLVSKIKPCMSQYKLQYGKTVNGSLKQL